MPRPTTVITTATSPMTELMDDHRRCLIRIAELETALRPFVDCLSYEQDGEQWYCRLDKSKASPSAYHIAAILIGRRET